MESVNLPVVMPLFSTYHWLATPGVAAKQNDTSDIWYFNNVIQWKCERKFLWGYTSPEFSLCKGNLWDIPFLEIGGVNNTKFTRNCSVEIIKTMLNKGFYVEFSGVDDFYIEGKSFYNTRHFDHDGLISGYDDQKETFTVVAYDSRWIYRSFETSQSGFEAGLKEMCDRGIYGQIWGMNPKNDKQSLNIPLIREQIKIYLNSNLDMYPPTCSDTAYGFVVYDYLLMYLNALKSGLIPIERIDRRIFRLLWEHKRCMYLRLCEIEKFLNWPDDLSKSYYNIVEVCNSIRFLYSKLTVKYSECLLSSIKEKLNIVRNNEFSILKSFIEKSQVYDE